MKKHTTHYFGCECREKMFKELLEILEMFHTFAENAVNCDVCELIKKAKEMIK